MTPEEVIALDAAHVWHPYAAMPAAVPTIAISSASGVRLQLVQPAGEVTELIDAMSSWWAAIWGYRHPVIDAAAHAQIDTMSHVMFGGLTHEPAVALVAKLVEITPPGLEHVFLCDSGSVSVEVAVKMCLQFWQSRGQPSKTKMMTWRGGYHGDTFQPMSVCDPDGGMHHLWSGVLPTQVFADRPPPRYDAPLDPKYVEHWRRLLNANHHEVAGIIVEPVVQGAGGMAFHNPQYLKMLRDLADEFDVLLVFDEIATGFGRSGALFAADHAGVMPDVMCLGKALTGGYLSMAATLCTPRVADTISEGEMPVLAHGPTFMGNPLAASIALASIGLLESNDWSGAVSRIEAGLTSGLSGASSIDGVIDVRILGAIGVIELDHEVDMEIATATAVAAGVWLRPFRNLVYAMPPYVSSNDDLAAMCAAMIAVATSA